MSITPTIEQTADGMGGSQGYTESREKGREKSTISFLCLYHHLMVIIMSCCRYRLHTLWIYSNKERQKDLWLFRASPYASVCVGKYLESRLSAIPRHPHPRLPDGRLKRHKCKKSAFGGKKSPAHAGRKRDYLISYRGNR